MTAKKYFIVFTTSLVIFSVVIAPLKSSAPSKLCRIDQSNVQFKNDERFERNFFQSFINFLNSARLDSTKSKNLQLLRLILTHVRGTDSMEKFEKDKNQKELKTPSQNALSVFELNWRLKLLIENWWSHRTVPEQSTLDSAELPTVLSRELVVLLWKNGWPRVKSTIENILMIQLVHNLTAEEISSGWLHQLQTNCTLNSMQCFQIGRHSMSTKQHTVAIDWLDLARRKAKFDGLTSLANAEFALKAAIQNHNTEFDSILVSNFQLDERFFNRKLRAYAPQDYLRAKRQRDIQLKRHAGKRLKSYAKLNYIGLCSGRNYQSNEEISRLVCWQEFKMHPSLLIGPAKMELIARNPDVVQIYDFLRKQDTSNFIPGFNKVSDENIKSSTVRRIEALTGLKFINYDPAGSMQIQAYQPGGHVLPAKDQTKCSSHMSNKFPLATFVVHLNSSSDEKEGGIAFPYCGIVARPVEGSALFWFNILSDGTEDQNSIHGICPTTTGNKLAKLEIPFDGKHVLGKCNRVKGVRFQIPKNNVYFQMAVKPLRKFSKHQREPVKAGKDLFLKYSRTSINGLTELVQLEWKFYPRIKRFYEKNLSKSKELNSVKYDLEENNTGVMKCLQDFEDSTKNLVDDLNQLPINDLTKVRKVALTPLAIYKVIGRFRKYYLPWTVGRSQSGNQLKRKIAAFLDKNYNVSGGPLHDDFEEAMFAILKIQFIYDLPIKDVARGILDGVETKVTLNAKDCFLIGRHGVFIHYFTTGIQWLEHAMDLVEIYGDDSISPDEIYNELATAEILHDDEYSKNLIPNYHFFVKPISQIPDRSQRITRRSVEDRIVEKDFHVEEHVDSKLWRVCSGKSLRSVAEESNLFCWYEKETHPIYKIGPIQAELLTLSNVSQVILYHNVLGNKTMEALNEFTFDQPIRMQYNSAEEDPFRSFVLLKVDFLDKLNSKSVKIVELTERITTFKKQTKIKDREVQYFSYAPGAARRRHFDDTGLGTSLVTAFVFYLSEIEKGGETAFPHLKFKVAPEKGSMVSWVNYLSDGELDTWTEHASCPVVLGHKSIFTSNFVEYDQHHLQCHLTRKTPYQVQCNGKPIK